MKKIISIFAILMTFSFILFSGIVYADSLDSINVDVDNTTIRPGEEVTVTINFGQDLGSYTFDVAYDNNIFEYVSADGGTANDTGEKVRVVFYDSTGGTNPRTYMTVTFKAKEGLTTSNPTEFLITAEGLANADSSVTFDDITSAIIKNVTVEPEYKDYTIKLEYSGDIVANEAKEMVLSYSSSMGRYYEHARLIAEATTPDGASVQLKGTDQTETEYDIIQSGWGDAQGYEIGGEDVYQELDLEATFSKAGSYSITLKLIDRDNSDQVIAEETFQITVNEASTAEEKTETTPSEDETTTDEDNSSDENTTSDDDTSSDENTTSSEEDISELPQTGINMYVPLIIVLSVLICASIYYNKRK